MAAPSSHEGHAGALPGSRDAAEVVNNGEYLLELNSE
jgi:hypothetical protein